MIGVRQPALIERIQHVAEETDMDPTQVVEAAVQEYLDHLETKKIHEETEAYWSMHADLVDQYVDEYVAVHRGQVVDHDSDVVRLETRIAEQFGETPVLIAPVADTCRRDVCSVSFRLDPPPELTA